MRTFAQKHKGTQENTPAKPRTPGRALSGKKLDVNSITHLQRPIENQAAKRLLRADMGDVEEGSTTPGFTRFGHDFSRIPVHAATFSPVRIQPSFAKGDKEQELAPGPRNEPAPALPQIEPAKPPVLTAEESVSGTVPDIGTLPGEGRRTGNEEIITALQTPEGAGNVVADIRLSFSQPKTDRAGGKDDPVVSGVSPGSFSQPGGRAVSPFGEEFYEPAFSGISYTFAGGKCTVKANLDVTCPWGTNSGGRTDVPSATDPVVTKTTWPVIKADLKPGAVPPFKSPRTKYYSQSLVERHEKFHGTDDHGWTTSTGMRTVRAYLEAGAVTAASAAADVSTLVNGARTRLIRENFNWYKGGGVSHDSYAGEIRAYADGKASYQKLADDIEKHGKTLP